MKNYQVKLSQKQLELIQKSLDLYSRLQCGQLEELSNIFSSPFQDRLSKINKEEINKCIGTMKNLLYPELSKNSSFGIFGPQTPDSAKIMYDMIQVIRHKIAWSNNPSGGMTINFDSPLKCSKENMISVEKLTSARLDSFINSLSGETKNKFIRYVEKSELNDLNITTLKSEKKDIDFNLIAEDIMNPKNKKEIREL